MQHVQNYINDLQQTLELLPIELLEDVIDILHEARHHGRQIFIMGNGGSASTASHFVADLAKNTRISGGPNFRAIGLTDNMAIFSAYANDEGYENVFAQQLASLVRPLDIVIAISASGNSPNVLKAIELANRVKAKTVGFTGFDGGKLGLMADVHVHVPSNCIEHVEDIHLMMEHLICKALREIAQQEHQAQVENQESISAAQNLIEENLHSVVSTRPVILQSIDMQTPGPEIDRKIIHENPKIEVIQPDDNLPSPDRIRSWLQLLYNISREVDPRLDLNTLLKRILSISMEGFSANSGSIMVLSEEGSVIQAVLAHAGQVNLHNSLGLGEIATQGLAGWVAENREAALVQNTLDDPRWLPREWEKNEEMHRSAVSVPIMDQDRVVGVLTLVQSSEGGFTSDDLALLTAIAVCVSFNSARALIVKR